MESWSQSRIFYSGDEYFESLMVDIRQATSSITIESYIFAVDTLTLTLLAELKTARERGCSVKIVVDGFGSYYYIPQLSRLCSEMGIEFRVFHPLPYPLATIRKTFLSSSNQGSLLFRRLNRRTHRKIAIIDQKRVYLGSFNFIQNHCASIVGTKAWRDTGVWVEGPPVRQLVQAFQISYLRTFIHGILNWVGRWKNRTEPYEKLLRLNNTQRMRRRLYRDLLIRISSAKSRVLITTAYFLPKGSLMRALLKAARKGIQVEIVIPGKSDVPVVKWAAFYIVRFLLQRRIKIYEYQKTILHAKTMIIDDKVLIGSFNLNHRSILHDLEVEVVLDDAESLQSMLQQWQIDIADSKVISEQEVKTPGLFARLIYNIAFLLRYIL